MWGQGVVMLPVCAFNRPILEGITRSVAPSCPSLGVLVRGVCRALRQSRNVNLTTPRVNLPVHLIVVGLSLLTSSVPRCGKCVHAFVGPRVLRCSSARARSVRRKYLDIPNVRRPIHHPAEVHMDCVSSRFRPRRR